VNDHLDSSDADIPPPNLSWQFSLRTLLIVTAVVSVVLAIGVHFAGVMFALAVAGVVQVVMLLAADWLIRPQNRRALAFVTAGSWIVLGSGLVIVGVREVVVRVGSDGLATYIDLAIWILALCLISFGIICYYIAAKRWRRLSRGLPSTQRDVNR
jgi:hypothetical protein